MTIRDGSEPWTYDDVKSPRNNSWFLCTLGARRALTFLEQQAEVDGDRLGVYGHSMGGKLTVATAASDKRVKAAAPSCGGISDRYNANPLHLATVSDPPALKNLSCPTIFLSPSNDFHGEIASLIPATQEMGDTEWRVTCSAHLNHRDYPENEVATQLWFDQRLKGKFVWPETPETSLELKTEDGIPRISVRPDDGEKRIIAVEVYYTQQGKIGKKHHYNHINQFWHYAHCKQTEGYDSWVAELPIFQTDKPLWVFANVVYALDKPTTGAGYYYGNYTAEAFNLSSLIQIVEPDTLKRAGVKPTLKRTNVIETFEGDWEKEWYTYSRNDWSIRTHKIYHPMWAAPEGASLTIEVLSEEPNKLIIGLDEFAAENDHQGSPEWREISIPRSHFKNALGEVREDWSELRELRLLASDRLRAGPRNEQKTRVVGGNWQGAPPQFRDLRWTN